MTSLNNKQDGVALLHRLSDRINAITEGTLFVSLLVLVGVTFLQVVFRFFFTALTWSEELSSFLLVWVSLLGMAVGFKRGSHIAVTFLLEKLTLSARKWVQLCIALFGLTFFGIVVYFGWVMMNTEATQVTPAMGLSMRWIYLMYPVTGAVTLLHICDSIVTLFGRGN
ncbi:MAG: TRAP transporter small permease [Spirochaetes bacterium]|nr:TRAP transporter small permease [Spirochaetota bacterium]